MTKQEAITRAKQIGCELKYDNNGECVRCTYEIIADALLEGYETAKADMKAILDDNWGYYLSKNGADACEELLEELFKGGTVMTNEEKARELVGGSWRAFNKEYRIALEMAEWKDKNPSDETIMLILNCIGYEEKSWVEFVRKELEKRK